jgi:hypothetical protein
MPLESTIVSTSMKSAEAKGWIAVKMHGSAYAPRGFPDVMFFRDGVTKFVEYKQPGKEPSPIQKVWHAKLRAKGFAVAVIDRAKDTEAFLEGVA